MQGPDEPEGVLRVFLVYRVHAEVKQEKEEAK